ncbi:MAG: 16S rRNA (guanine(527)-N(7))-methyltransferase RsmG [Kofleriaceae bacterium]
MPDYSKFLDLFEKWNKSINLSASKTRAEIALHVEDSTRIIGHLEKLGDSARVLDVGSGGGFPVVIAAMALPQIQFVSLEPVHKKNAFLKTAARELGLANLEALAIRLDQHEPADYDAAMSRATFDIGDWFAMALERVKPGGVVFGFEAIERDDLSGVERDHYTVDGKARSIVIKRRV